MTRVVLLLSGGLDSATLLYHLLGEGHNVSTLGVYYDQRHARELGAAQDIAAAANVRFLRADLHVGYLLSGSSQTDASIKVPHGHYTDESMRLTVVPNRNMIMLSVALGHAAAIGADAVAFAAHSGDHTVYPDCREEFFDALEATARLGNWHPIGILRPFVDWTKTMIVKRGADLGVPFKSTWSCYQGDRLHCGKCGTCVERREAFQLAGVDDPTAYETA